MPDEKTTVGELIAALRQFPTDMRVVVEGMEDGYDDVTVAQRVSVVVGRKKSSAYIGKHRERVEGMPVFEDAKIEDTVVLRYGG